MDRLLTTGSVVAVMGLLLIWLQYAFSVLTAMVGLFVFGVGCGIRIAGRIVRAQADAGRADAPVERVE